MPDIKSTISSWNNKYHDTSSGTKIWNNHIVNEFHLNGECLNKDIIYSAQATTGELNTRYRNNVANFNDINKENSTEKTYLGIKNQQQTF